MRHISFFCLRRSPSFHGTSSSLCSSSFSRFLIPISVSLVTGNCSPSVSLHQFSQFCRSLSASSPITCNKPLSRRPMSPFLKRTEGVKKILDLFSSFSVWNDEKIPRSLTKLSVPFHPYTVSEVIRKSVNLDIALCFFNWLITSKNDFEPDSYIYNSLIYRLGKSGRLEEMQSVSNLSVIKGKASVVTFTSVISGFKSAMEIQKAQEAWNQMKELGFKPCHKTYTVMIDLYASVKMYEEAGEYYLLILKDNLWPSIKTCTVLMNHLVQEGKLDAALDIFQGLMKVNLRPNPVTCAYIMLGYAKLGDMYSVLKLVRDFKDYGHHPGALGNSFISVLKYLLCEGRSEDADKIMKEGWPESSDEDRKKKIIEFQVKIHNASCHADIMNEGIEESLDSSLSDFEEDEEGCDEHVIPYSSTDTSTLLNVVAFVKCLFPWTNATVRTLEKSNLRFDCDLVSKILNRLSRADSGWKFYCWVVKQPGFAHDKYTCHQMMKLFLRDQGFSKAKRLLVEAHKEHLTLPLHTYGSVLKHCGLQKDSEFALQVFELLKESGLSPNESCYKYLIHALFKCNRYWRVATICSEMTKAGFPLDETMYSLLISGFAGAGKISIVRKLLKQMRASNFEPDAYVYKALIRTYDRKGKLDKAKRIYNAMRRDGIKPSPQINELMVDIFTRLGDHKKACTIKDEMKSVAFVSGIAKQALIDQYLHFHSIFKKNLAENISSQPIAAGVCM